MSENAELSISVIIPAFNAEPFIREAIHSALEQSHRPAEIIVVDDGSTDRTGSVVEGFGESVSLFHQDHQGAAAARNLGARNASGEFLAFLDADDLWIQSKLELQLALFHNNPALDMVFGNVLQFSDDAHLGNAESTSKYVGYIPGTMLIRRRSFERAGFFSTEYHLGEFIDWYLKAREIGLTEYVLPHVMTKRRVHHDNTGIRESKHRSDYVHILKAALDRKKNRRDRATEH